MVRVRLETWPVAGRCGARMWSIGFFFTRFLILIFGFLLVFEREVLGRGYSLIFKVKKYSLATYSVFVFVI